MRSFTHILYKVIREVTWADLCLDCIPGDALEYCENHTSANDVAKRGLSNVGAMFGDMGKAMKDPKGAMKFAGEKIKKGVSLTHYTINS